MKIKSFFLTGLLVLLSACGQSEYELEQLVPEEYHKILYVKDSGKQEITLYDTEDSSNYTFSIIKAGSDPTLTASANICVLTQDELDESYSQPEGVNYRVIDAAAYELETTYVDFASSECYKLVNVTLNPQKVKNDIQTDLTATWVLPLYISSVNDSIDSERNELLLQMTVYGME